MTGVVKYGQDSGALMALAAICLALLTILTVWRLRRFKHTLVSETGGAVFYGMLLGLLVRCLSWDWGETAETGVCSCEGLNISLSMLMVNISSNARCHQDIGSIIQRCGATHMETFDPEVLFNLFLPPIIFYGAYTLNQKRFFENLGSILTFAFFGTIISFLIIGASVYGFTRLMVPGRAADGKFLLTDCLLFGAIMSATDPVSVLGLLGRQRVDPALHALLFGESVLNDAVAIVLTHAVTAYNQMGAGHTFDPAAFFLSVGYFLGVFAGSLLLGFAFTVITALLTKLTRLHESPLLETSVFLLLSWCSFLSAEACRLSGIVAVLFCGLSQARYTTLNLSSEGRIRTKQLFEVFNFLGEIFIFSYMGFVLLTFRHHVFKALFISGAFLSVVVSRACHVYPLSFLLNARRSGAVPRNFQHFMTLAGTRGVVAFSLAMRDTSDKARCAILSTALLLVCVTIWVLGVVAEPALRCLDIRVGVDADENPDLPPEVASGRPDTTRTLWHRLDSQYVKPLLTHSGLPPSASPPQCCRRLAGLLSGRRAHTDEEQLREAESAPDAAAAPEEEAADWVDSTGGDSGCGGNQEDLLEGDLGLGSVPALPREQRNSRSDP